MKKSTLFLSALFFLMGGLTLGAYANVFSTADDDDEGTEIILNEKIVALTIISAYVCVMSFSSVYDNKQALADEGLIFNCSHGPETCARIVTQNSNGGYTTYYYREPAKEADEETGVIVE
jgi:hypothetical protein